MSLKILFYLSTLLIFISVIGLLVTKDIVHSCVLLLSTLLGVAGLYLTLGAEFVAATQVMVYVGGVVVLMLFAIMLTGGKSYKSPQIRIGLRQIPMMGNKFTLSVGAFSSLLFLAIIYKIFTSLSSLKQGAVEQITTSSVSKLGELLLTDHVLAFEFSSVLLLGALIGAAIIARPQGRSQ